MENYDKSTPYFKLKFVIKDGFKDNGFMHSKLTLIVASAAEAILCVTAFEPISKDFAVHHFSGGRKETYNTGQWLEFVYRSKFITGATQPELFTEKTA